MTNEYFELVDLNGARLKIDNNIEEILAESIRFDIVIFVYDFNKLYNDADVNSKIYRYNIDKIIDEFLTTPPSNNVMQVSIESNDDESDDEQDSIQTDGNDYTIEIDFDDYSELIKPDEYKDLLEDYEIFQTRYGIPADELNDYLLDALENYTRNYNQFS